MRTHSNEYLELMQEAWEYQDFLSVELNKHGIILQNFSSCKHQIHAENTLGLELKLDRRLKETGNYYIETAEKEREREGAYAPSGIYSSCWLYGIGNYNALAIFSTNRLQEIHRGLSNDLDPRRYPGIELKRTPTSEGFIIPLTTARDFVLYEKVIVFEHEEC